jgi:hypothetical protein
MSEPTDIILINGIGHERVGRVLNAVVVQSRTDFVITVETQSHKFSGQGLPIRGVLVFEDGQVYAHRVLGREHCVYSVLPLVPQVHYRLDCFAQMQLLHRELQRGAKVLYYASWSDVRSY